MYPTDRRTFLGSAAALAATGLGTLEAAAPSETVNVAVLGCGRGASLACTRCGASVCFACGASVCRSTHSAVS